MNHDYEKSKRALIAIALFGSIVLPARAQIQLAPAPQCTPEEKKDLENYATTIRKFKQIGADQMKLVCEAVEAGKAGVSTALGPRLEKLDEFVKDVNPILKKWLGTAIPEDLKSKIDIDAASRLCFVQKGKAESFLEEEAKRIEAELERCGIRI